MTNYEVLKQASNPSKYLPANPFISILIPVYNRELLVLKAINSALSQDYDNFEVVISDNFSSDNTLNACMDLCHADPRVTIIRQRENLGPVPNWYAAGLACRGSFVKVLFSDDMLNFNCLSSMIHALDASVGFVYCDFIISSTEQYFNKVNETKTLNQEFDCLRSELGLLKFLFNRFVPINSIPVSPGAAIFHRSHYLFSLSQSIASPACIESMTTGAGPDLLLFLDALKSYPKFVHIKKKLVFFRSHDNSFTIGKLKKQVQIGYSKSTEIFFLNIFFPWNLFYQLRKSLKSLQSILRIA